MGEALSLDEKWQFKKQLQSLPRNSAPNRLHRRCFLTGRPRANYRDFGLSKHVLREMAHACLLHGVTKSSWQKSISNKQIQVENFRWKMELKIPQMNWGGFLFRRVKDELLVWSIKNMLLFHNAGQSSLVARKAHNLEVTGSNPVSAKFIIRNIIRS